MEPFGKRRWTVNDDFDASLDRLDRITKYGQREKLKHDKLIEHQLNINHLLGVKLVMRKIDFHAELKEYHEINQMLDNRVEITSFKDNLEIPTTEFMIEIINDRILVLFQEKQFFLGMLEGLPHYYNNCYYVEINDELLRKLLSDIARRCGVENYKDSDFINALYSDFIKKLISFEINPISPNLKSYKERGTKITKLPKDDRTNDYFLRKDIIKRLDK